MQIVLSQDKPQVCSLDSNSKHNWTKKIEVASIDRPFLQQIFQGKAEIQSQFTQIFSHQDDHQVRSWDINSYVTEKLKQAQLLLIARISLRQFFQDLHFPRYMFSSSQVRSSMRKMTQSEMSN